MPPPTPSPVDNPEAGVFNVAAYGAVGNGTSLAGVSGTAGQNTITLASAQLTAADTGKLILVPLAGSYNTARGTVRPATLVTTITAVSGTTVTLNEPLANTVSDVDALYGAGSSEAIGGAIRAAGQAGGGIVFIPAGVYLLNADLDLPSQVSVRGTGPGSRLVLAGAKHAFYIKGQSGCQIADLGIDLFNIQDFCTGVQVTSAGTEPDTWSEDIRVERCSLYNSLYLSASSGATLYAVLLAGCRRAWVTDNFVQGAEIKAADGPGVSGVHVTGNTISHPLQYGVTVVTGSGSISDYVVADNIFQEIRGQGAIYVGNDSNDTDANITCERISIAGNVMTGVPSALGFFIELRIPRVARDWVVRDNVMRIVGGTPCGVSGIFVSPRKVSPAVLDNLVITGNVISGTDQPGIHLDSLRGLPKNSASPCVPGAPEAAQPKVNGFLIQGNTLAGTAGIAVISQYSGDMNAYWNGRIADNLVHGGSIALLNGGPVDICDNLIDTPATLPVAVSTAAGFNSPELVTGAGIVLGAAAAKSTVTAMVYNNRIRNGTHESTLVNGIREAGDAAGVFDVVYSGNVITDNSGAPIQKIGS